MSQEPALPRTEQILQDGLARGHHIGYQLTVCPKDRDAIHLVGGEARPGVSMQTDTLMLWLSSGKPLTTVAIAQQVEQGALHLDNPVADYLPDFAAGGKQDVTIRHLLTHTGGFRAANSGWPDATWAAMIQAVCAARLEPRWEPGVKTGYHPFTSWFILAELVRVADGRDFPTYIREEVLLPAGMRNSWIALPQDEVETYADRVGHMQNTAVSPPRPHPNDAGPREMASCNPGGSARGPVQELAGFYRHLLQGGGPLLKPESVANFTARHHTGTRDVTFQHEMDWGLGFMVNSARYGTETVPYGFGRHASDAVFGHGGAESSHAFADPAHELAVAWVCNGTPGPTAHHQRNFAINTAIYEDLGLQLR